MTNKNNRFKEEPVIVIGSGIAGLLLSIELAEAGCKVKLVTKEAVDQSNSAWAQGGLAAVTGANVADSKEQHLADTIAAGDGLTDPIVAERITADGARLVHRLAKHGVAFDQSSLSLEGGHRMARVLHSADSTGRTIIDALIKTALGCPSIEIIEHCFLKSILTESSSSTVIAPKTSGIVALMTNEHDGTDKTSVREIVIEGRAVVLATGGLGQVYARTTNPKTATGDGIAAAYRAGAHLVDMEFVQFHPTALHLEGAPAFLISEAARGAGAVLLDKNGDRFAQWYHADGELATRDIVSRAIHFSMSEQNTDHVWLDMRRLGEKKLLDQFPNIVGKLRSFGLDPVRELVPVSPAAHYFMGGIYADEFGRTSVQNLFAIGECASTGLHGANRLASNSLLEAGVMALRLAEVLSHDGRSAALRIEGSNNIGQINRSYRSPGSLDLRHFPKAIDPNFLPKHFDSEFFANLMLSNAGLVRTEESLLNILKYGESESPLLVPEIDSSDMAITANSVTTEIEKKATYLLGMMIAQAALIRQESRGAHWRQDYPILDANRFESRLFSARSGYEWRPISNVVPVPRIFIPLK